LSDFLGDYIKKINMGVLPKTNFNYNLKGFMITGGPVPSNDDETRQSIMKVIEKYYGGYIDKDKFALAIEHGTMGENVEKYHHFHCILTATDGHMIKWKKTCCEALKQKVCVEDANGRKPNCQANHTREQKKGVSTYSLLLKYVTEPNKIKDCDGNLTTRANFVPTRAERLQDISDAMRKYGQHSKEHRMAVLEYGIALVDALRSTGKDLQ
jgi:hypothetical protein